MNMKETPPNHDRMGLAMRAWIRYVLAIIILSAVLFGSAGTVDYWQAKFYLVGMFAIMFLVGVYFLKVAPDLVERRLQMRETRPTQHALMNLGIPVTAGIYIIPGLARRYDRLNVPDAVVYASLLLVIASYLATVYVLLVNQFAGRTITVEKSQTVVSTGPYAYVRHPMYSFVLPMFVFTPISLGSYYGVISAVLLIPILVYRLLDEEIALQKDLDGYADYMEQVPYRLIPHVY